MLGKKKEICVFLVTSKKKIKVGRSLLNFFFFFLIFYLLFSLILIRNRCFVCPKYIMKRGLFGPVT